jgi:catechol 2,3-dioxygenase-like lactoylglutathione lyase family enzyme
MVRRLTHLGLCVSDLERSLRFYRDVLGFTEDSTRPPLAMRGEPAATLLGLPDVDLRALYLRRDGVCLELLAYPAPGSLGRDGPRPMNRVGFSHLSFEVEALEPVLERVRAAGGRVLDASRIPPAVFVTDPDGARIELVQAAARPSRAPDARRGAS